MAPNDWTLNGNSNTDPATNFLGTTDNQPLVINPSGGVNIGIYDSVIPYPKLAVTIPGVTVGPETTEVLRVMSHGIPNVKNQNSAGLSVGAFEGGINGRSRLDINVAGTPGSSNIWGSVPDVTAMTLRGDGHVGIGTTDPDTMLDVQATDSSAAAIFGRSHVSAGVWGYSDSETGVGVQGQCIDGAGVAGTGGTGVSGLSGLGNGVLGQAEGTQPAVAGVIIVPSGTGAGVYGSSDNGPGVSAASLNQAAVDATSTRNWCGYFHSVGDDTNSAKGVYISVPAGQPGLQVASGTKNAVVATSQGTRALHTEESTGVWFTDYGFGELQAGHAVVTIDPLFAETVNLDEPYHVFVQLNDLAAEGAAVINKTASSFDVVEIRNGHSNAEFSYRLVAKRRGYEQNRLERTPWADDDPNLYPEKREAWEAQRQLRRPVIPRIDVPDRPPQRP